MYIVICKCYEKILKENHVGACVSKAAERPQTRTVEGGVVGALRHWCLGGGAWHKPSKHKGGEGEQA